MLSLTCTPPPVVVVGVELLDELDAGALLVGGCDEAGARRAVVQHRAARVSMKTHAQVPTHLQRA